MSEDNSVQGFLEGSVRNAKARFEQVSEERLRKFIEAQPDIEGEVTLSDIRYPTEGAGSSNGIAFFTAHFKHAGEPVTRKLVLRYSPGVQLLKQKRFADEFNTLQAVATAALPVPRVLWLDAAGDAVGRACYVMEAVEGDTPSAAMYSAGPLANISPEERKERMLLAADFHGRLRAAKIGPDSVPHLVGRGNGATEIERELNWWFQEVLMVREPDDEKVQTIQALLDWLVAKRPGDLYDAGLVHGDAQIANIIYNDGHIAAVIDWELSYLGHNETDLALICFNTRTQHLADIPVDGTPSDEEYIARFEQTSGHRVQHWPYFTLMNMYRVMAVTSLAEGYLPSFDAVWAFYGNELDNAWKSARAVYGN